MSYDYGFLAPIIYFIYALILLNYLQFSMSYQLLTSSSDITTSSKPSLLINSFMSHICQNSVLLLYMANCLAQLEVVVNM